MTHAISISPRAIQFWMSVIFSTDNRFLAIKRREIITEGKVRKFKKSDFLTA